MKGEKRKQEVNLRSRVWGNFTNFQARGGKNTMLSVIHALRILFETVKVRIAVYYVTQILRAASKKVGRAQSE